MHGRTIVASIMFNHAPLSYNVKWVEHRICQTMGPRLYGKKYWVEFGKNPCSKAWLSDEKAGEMIREWKKQIKKLTISEMD